MLATKLQRSSSSHFSLQKSKHPKRYFVCNAEEPNFHMKLFFSNNTLEAFLFFSNNKMKKIKQYTERSSLGVPQRWASEKCDQEMEGREALKIFVF